MNRPGYLFPWGSRVGTQLRGQRSGQIMHAVGCAIDGGGFIHGLDGFVCQRCAQTADDRVDALLLRLDQRAGGVA